MTGESWPVRRRRRSPARPPTKAELEPSCEWLLVDAHLVGAEIQLLREDARRFGEAVRLGGVWGKSVVLRGPDASVGVFADLGYPTLSPLDWLPTASRETFSVRLNMDRMGELAKLLASEIGDFWYPWHTHWVPVPERR